jgi:hypothetical protein
VSVTAWNKSIFPLFNAQEMAKFVHGKGEYRGLSTAQVLKQWEQVITISLFPKKIWPL